MKACLAVLCFFALSASAQRMEENLNRGEELLLAGEYRAAKFYLTSARQQAKKKSTREEADRALGELFLLQNEFDSARLIMDRLPQSVTLHFLLGLSSFQKGDYNTALTAFVNARPDAREDLLRSKIDFYTGVIRFRKRSRETLPLAIEDLNHAVTGFKKDSIRNYLRLAEARLQLADVLRLQGKPDSVSPEIQMALQILKISPYARPLSEANAFAIEGRAQYTRNDFKSARKAFEKSIDILQKNNGDSTTIGINYNNLALCFDKLQELHECGEAFSHATSYWKNLKDQPDRLVPFLNNYAVFLQSIEETSEATNLLKRAEKELVSPKLQSRQTHFQTYYNLALSHYDLEDFNSCKIYLDLLDTLKMNNPGLLSASQEMQISQLRAMWLRKQKQFSSALTICSEVNARLDSIELEDNRRYDFYAIYGDILTSANNYTASVQQLHHALRGWNELQNRKGIIEVNNLLAMSFFNRHAYDSADYFSNQSLRANSIPSEGLTVPYLDPQEAIQSCYLIIASSLKRFQRSSKAADLDSMEPFEQLGIGLIRSTRKNLYRDNDQIGYNKRVTKFYDACCLLHYFHALGNSANAASQFFEYAEESKFQALSNSLLSSRVNSFREVNGALLEEERDLARQTVIENQQLVNLITTESSESDLELRKSETRAELQALEIRHQNFMDSLRRNFSGYYVLKYGGQPITMSELQKELRPDEVVLQLKVIDSLIVAQVIAKQTTSFVILPGASEMKREIIKLRNLIKARIQSEYNQLAHDLYIRLLAPIEQKLSLSHTQFKMVTIIPDDFFYQLPFEALVEKVSPLRYYIQSREINYAYSCNLLVENLRKAGTRESERFLGVAPSFQIQSTPVLSTRQTRGTNALTSVRYDDFGFQPLMENNSEVNLIGDVAGTGTVAHTLLRGDSANESNLKKMDLSQYGYVHFATHGFTNLNDSGFSGLALTNSGTAGEDNILFTSEIYRLKLNARLVCLSACETGLGQDVPGEGLIGLGRAFLYSGAQNMIVSLWKVPDASTSKFMINFYKDLFTNHNSLTTALRTTKLKMLAMDAYKSPYYWAPFILIGN